MLRTLIIDDEAHIRETLGKLLERHCSEAVLVGKANGVKSGIEAIRRFNPDLVLLDINMADGSGFELLRALSPITFRVIFISAMDKSTIRAFKLSGMEYLLKPVNPEELREAIERVMKTQIRHFDLQLKALEENVRE